VTDFQQFEGLKINNRCPSKVSSSNIFSLSESFTATKDTFGRIDLLINNAEIRNDKFWELETDVNLVRQILSSLVVKR
jgi:NAD(P)-dependent dehydrogenase (short-subunit alcohol dehydrogenase family)